MTMMMKHSIKLLFMGTPEFALPSLKMLIEEGYNICGVFSQPDRVAGRGHKVTPPPVKVVAQENNIPVFQYEKVKSEEGVAKIKALAPDLIITAAFGHILTQEILDIPKYGCINVHASLLPKLRGAAPIQWAIINGETKTGITTMYTVLALDAGDILEQDEMGIPKEITAGELYEKLSVLGKDTLKRTLKKLEEGTLKRTPQKEEEATYFPMFKKGFGGIDFNKNCVDIYNFVRGTNPVPCAYLMYKEEKIKVFEVGYKLEVHNKKIGSIALADAKEGLFIYAKDGIVEIKTMQRANSKPMSAKESLRGRDIDDSYLFTNL